MDNISVEKSDVKSSLKKSFFRGNHFNFVTSIIFKLIMGGTDFGLSVMLMYIIDSAVSRDIDALTKTIIFCASFIVINLAAQFFYRYSFAGFMRKGVLRYRQSVFDYLLKKSAGAFRHENSSRYISMLTNDVTSMETDFYSRMFLAITCMVQFAASIVIMLYTSAFLTLFAVIFAAIPVTLGLLTGQKLGPAQEKISDENESFVGSVKDLLSGFLTIKVFKIEKHASMQFKERNEKLEQSKYSFRLLDRLIGMFSECAQSISFFGIFIVGAYMVITDRGVTIGTITMFLQLMNYMLAPLSTVIPLFGAYKAKEALIDKAAESITEETDRESAAANALFPEDFKEGIEIRGLGFGYESGGEVLHDINYHFAPGKSYCIVGPSGSGKSTFLNLLLGSLGDYKGSIKYGGVELKDIGTDSLYENVSQVQQDVFLFDDTLKNNITLYRNIDEGKIDKAVTGAGLGELISSHGEDYQCGEGGKNLSGGEKQRVSIARSLLQESKVMLLDEVTSSLDAATAEHVLNTVLNIREVTRIVITHQLNPNVLARFDEILVLKNGAVTETGTYEKLMEQKGFLYSLVTLES
ncbi:MAG: ABC transporter ATP-binding protein [Eubacterium sp.]|jgi:ATP-binding cassette subfamily B protein